MFCSFRNSPIVLLTLFNIFLRCYWKFNLVSKIIPRLLRRDLFDWLIVEINRRMTCLLGFTRENNFLGLSAWVRLKLIFHWNAQMFIFLKSPFKWLAEVLTFRTMEKRNVSSAKSLAVVDRSSGRSLMQIKNNIGSSMEPWGTPASMLAQDEVNLMVVS